MTMPVTIPPNPTGQLLTVAMASNNAASPSFTNKAYREQLPRWVLCLDQLGGTDYIRAKGEVYQPKMPAELDKDYETRLQRSDYFAMFEETCVGLTGMVMRRPIDFEDNTPQELLDLAEDVDGLGTGLNIWARHFLFDSLARGHMGLLVDYPEVADPITVAVEREYGIRAYFCAVAPENILNWRTVVEGGRVLLALLTLREKTSVPSGEFGDREITRYRVYRRTAGAGGGKAVVTVEVWEGDERGQKVTKVKDATVIRPVTMIPFAVHYSGQRLAYLYSKPPLLELAYVNIAHYQVNSDYRNSLHISSCPIFVTKGLRRRAGGNQIVGATIGLEVGKEGDAKYVEHTGAALDSARTAIQDIETRAASLGLAMLKRETRAAETAEAKRLDKSEQESKLSIAAKNLEDVLEVAFGYAAEFMGIDFETECIVNQDFSDLTFDPDMIRALNEMVAAGNLTRQTLWDLLQRGGTLPDSFDAEDEEKQLSKQSDNANLLQQVQDAARLRGMQGVGPDGKPLPPGAGNGKPMMPGGKPPLRMIAGGKRPPPNGQAKA